MTAAVLERPRAPHGNKHGAPVVTRADERGPIVASICALLQLRGHRVHPIAKPRRFVSAETRRRCFAALRALAVRDPLAPRAERRGKIGGTWIGEGNDRRYVGGVRLGYAIAVLRILLDNVQSDGICWRSYDGLASEAERGRAWIFETIEILEALGILVRVRMSYRIGPLGIRPHGAPRANGYYLPLAREDDAPAAAELPAGVEAEAAPSRSVFVPRVTYEPAAERLAPVVLALEHLREVGRVEVPTDAGFAAKLLGFGQKVHQSDPAKRNLSAWLVEAAILGAAEGTAQPAADGGAPLGLDGPHGILTLLYRCIRAADPKRTPRPSRRASSRVAVQESAAASAPSVGPPARWGAFEPAPRGAPRHGAPAAMVAPAPPVERGAPRPPVVRPDVSAEVARLRAQRAELVAEDAEAAAAVAELRARLRGPPD